MPLVPSIFCEGGYRRHRGGERAPSCAGAHLQTRMTSLMSTPMQSRITQTESAWAWLSFVVALALTIPLIWRAWIIIRPNTYTGGDGKAWQSCCVKFASLPTSSWQSDQHLGKPGLLALFSDDPLFATPRAI